MVADGFFVKSPRDYPERTSIRASPVEHVSNKTLPQLVGHETKPKAPPRQRPALEVKPKQPPAVERLLRYLDDELVVQGLADQEPCLERLALFQTVFSRILEQLPSYRPVLWAIKAEYDAVLREQAKTVEAFQAMQARLHIFRAETVGLVGQSTALYHEEITRERSRVEVLENENIRLKAANEKYEKERDGNYKKAENAEK